MDGGAHRGAGPAPIPRSLPRSYPPTDPIARPIPIHPRGDRPGIAETPRHVRPNVVVGDELVLDRRMERFQHEGFRVTALNFDQASSHRELTERLLLVFFEQQVIGSGVHILAGLEVEGEGQIRVSQGWETDEAGVLVDEDNPLAEFAHLTEEHVHNRFSRAGGLAVEDMVGFFDNDSVVESLAGGVAVEPVVVNPEQQALDQKHLVDVGQAVEFENDRMAEQFREVSLTLDVHDLAHLAIAQRPHRAQGGGHPVGRAPGDFHGLDLLQEVLHRRVSDHRARVETEPTVQFLQGVLEDEHDAFADIGGVGKNLDQFLDPGGRLGSWRRNQRIEPERRDIAPHSIDLDLIAELGLEQRPVVLLPIQNKKGFLLVQESSEERVTEIGLAGTAPAENRHVLKPFVFPDGESPEGLLLEDDVSHRVISLEHLRRRRKKHRGRLIGSGLEILKTENAEILLNLFAPLEIGDLIRLPHAVGFLPRKGFKYRHISSTSIPPSAPRLLNQNEHGAKSGFPTPSNFPALARQARSPLRHSGPRSGIQPPEFPFEPSPNAFDLGHAFTPPVCCYRGEKNRVIYKGCAGGEVLRHFSGVIG